MNEDPIRSRVHYQDHDGQLTHVTDQPTEDLILDRNKELRKNPGVIRDLGQNQEGGTWGRMVATIPFIAFEKAKRDGFDLSSKDTKHANNEMLRFLKSDEGRQCLIQG